MPSIKKGKYTERYIETTWTEEELTNLIQEKFCQLHQLPYSTEVKVEFDISTGIILRGVTAQCKKETYEEDPS